MGQLRDGGTLYRHEYRVCWSRLCVSRSRLTCPSFVATIGPKVAQGKYAGTGNNGWGMFGPCFRFLPGAPGANVLQENSLVGKTIKPVCTSTATRFALRSTFATTGKLQVRAASSTVGTCANLPKPSQRLPHQHLAGHRLLRGSSRTVLPSLTERNRRHLAEACRSRL